MGLALTMMLTGSLLTEPFMFLLSVSWGQGLGVWGLGFRDSVKVSGLGDCG